MSNLNRSNLGNANISGMPEEIGLVGNQFGVATTLLYALSCSLRTLANDSEIRNLCSI